MTTDHGGPSDELNHADNGDPQVRTIPFLLAADGVSPDAADLEGASLYDVAPTVLDWLGVDAPAGVMVGRSRLP
jgi:arylsulfatase A-like enzyme